MSSSVAICSICLQDARPGFEDLQSISACGHVFHEPCLQQWMELCPAGRDPRCPVCKGSISCRAHDVHRLIFQSTESDSTQSQVSPSRNRQTAAEDLKHVNCSSSFCKLESELGAAMKSSTVTNCIIEQFKELESQVAANLQRAEKAEAATVVAGRGLDQCRQILQEYRQELEDLKEKIRAIEEMEQALWDRDFGVKSLLRIRPRHAFLVIVFFLLAHVIAIMLAEGNC